MKPSVFLSHTSELQKYPTDRSFYASAEQAVKNLGYAIIGQPEFSAETTSVAEVLSRKIAEADYVVCIIGLRWGSPVREQPEVSHTEYEYNEAVRLDKPRFVFLIDEEALPAAAVEKNLDYIPRQRAFRERLEQEDHLIQVIEAQDTLNSAVYKAIREWEDNHGHHALSSAAPAELPPFDDIALMLKRGDVIPFLGPEAGLPPDYRPPRTEPRPERQELIARFADRVPSDLELSLLLADFSQYPPGQRLALPDVASYYSVTSGASFVEQRLREAYLADRAPRAIHEYLASLDTHLLIFATGFDDLMEQALVAAGKPFKTVIQPGNRDLADRIIVIDGPQAEPRAQHPQEVDVDLSAESLVYKPHGSIIRNGEDWDQFIATEDSNIDVLGGLAGKSLPDQLTDPMTQKRFLFLGVGLESWTTRSMLSRIKADLTGEAAFPRVNKKPAWAVRRDVSSLDKRLWTALNAKVYDMDLDRFVLGLKGAQ